MLLGGGEMVISYCAIGPVGHQSIFSSPTSLLSVHTYDSHAIFIHDSILHLGPVNVVYIDTDYIHESPSLKHQFCKARVAIDYVTSFFKDAVTSILIEVKISRIAIQSAE